MKVFIHASVEGDAREALKKLLEDAGCEVVDEPTDIDEEVHEANAEKDQEVKPALTCIVLLDPELLTDECEADLRTVVNRGCPVVGVWPPGSGGDQPPLDVIADSVAWDAPSIGKSVCGEPQRQRGDGSPATPPRTDRKRKDRGGCP